MCSEFMQSLICFKLTHIISGLFMMFKKKVGYTHILKSLNVFKFWNQLEVNVKIAHNLQNK